jgi:hypothetical protein
MTRRLRLFQIIILILFVSSALYLVGGFVYYRWLQDSDIVEEVSPMKIYPNVLHEGEQNACFTIGVNKKMPLEAYCSLYFDDHKKYVIDDWVGNIGVGINTVQRCFSMPTHLEDSAGRFRFRVTYPLNPFRNVIYTFVSDSVSIILNKK